jgi:hypothetical protein
VALPFLPSFGRRSAAASSARPRRTVFVCRTVNREAWTPKAEGPPADAAAHVVAARAVHASLRLLGGLATRRPTRTATAPRPRAGRRHVLTACQAQKVGGVRVGVSIDR